jgi:hypothetical protein
MGRRLGLVGRGPRPCALGQVTASALPHQPCGRPIPLQTQFVAELESMAGAQREVAPVRRLEVGRKPFGVAAGKLSREDGGADSVALSRWVGAEEAGW